jgi:D-alanine--poly(phosphoribitol) ligase subunit 1
MFGGGELVRSGPPGMQALPQELAGWRELLAQRVPPYMIPSELLACHGFPLTQTDKADRKQLERMYLDSRMRPAKDHKDPQA